MITWRTDVCDPPQMAPFHVKSHEVGEILDQVTPITGGDPCRPAQASS